MTDLRALEREMAKRVDDVILSRQSPPTSSGFNTASELGYECLRFQVGRRLVGEQRQRPGLAIARSFYMGTVLENPVIQLLRDAGYKIYQDPSSVFYEWKKYKLKGRIDGKIEIEIGKQRLLPLEVKTCSQRTFAAVRRCYENGTPLYKTEQVWMRKWPAQLTTYMLLFNEDLGLWVFLNKETGELLFWYYELDYEYAERLIKLAEETNKWVERGELPEAQFTEWCMRCDFRDRLCFPDEKLGEGVELVMDDQLIEEVERMAELEDKVKEYEVLREKIIGNKGRPGLFYGKSAVVGKVMITAKERKAARYEVPEELKDKLVRVESMSYIHKVEKLNGDEAET